MVIETKTDWQHQTHRRAAIVFDQLRAAIAALAASRQMTEEEFLNDPNNPYLGLLDKLYGEDFQLGRLLDVSDLLLHAEGPAARDFLPDLHAASWLCASADKHLRSLAVATMDLGRDQVAAIKRAVGLRLTGFAPGSLYAGFKVMPSEDDLLLGVDERVFLEVREAIQRLPLIPSHIDDEAVREDIVELLPDPAMRDASLLAAFNLAPTGRMGIHTLEIAVPGSPAAALGQRERVVLREALRRPHLVNRKTGTFVGEIREFDLDKTRFHLRDVPQFGTIRCVLPETTKAQAKHLLGEQVSVVGEYEVDRQGRPRLMLVHSIEITPRPNQPWLE